MDNITPATSFIWLVFWGVVGGMLAARLGRSVMAWAIFTAFFPPAVLILLLLGEPRFGGRSRAPDRPYNDRS